MATTVELLRQADAALDDVERERNRLAVELAQLTAGSLTVPGMLGIGDLAARRDSLIELIENIEHFVADVFPGLRKQAADTNDAALAARLLDVTRRIAGVSRSYSATGDLNADAVRLLVDTVAPAGLGLGVVALAIVAAAVIVRR